MGTRPIIFKDPDELRAWFEQNHGSKREAWLGFCKKGSGRRSITYADAVDAALCFGWIDGIRKRVDDALYTNRFTPRTSTSNWSQVNLRRFGELQRLGRVHPAGRRAYERRRAPSRTGLAYEDRKSIRLDSDLVRRFRTNARAWKFFQSEPPGRRQLAIFFVMSAKREDTRQRRLDAIIKACEGTRQVGVLRTAQPVSSRKRGTTPRSRRVG